MPLRSITFARFCSALNWLGVVVLVAGLGSAAFIWEAQDQVDRKNAAAQSADASAPLSLLDSRKQVRNVEIYYGELGVLVEEAKECLHGKPLARTIGIGSVVAAAGLFLAAARMRD